MKPIKMYFGVISVLINSLFLFGIERTIDCNYLIVYPDSFLFQANELADYRSYDDFDVCLVSWDSIQVNNTYETPDSALKDYLQFVWDSSSVPLEYIVLLGDWDIITPHTWFRSSDSSNHFDDNWFVVLDPLLISSQTPSVAMGRIPVENAVQLEQYLEKLYFYENRLQILPWQRRVIGIAGKPYSQDPECFFDGLLLDNSDDFINQNLEYKFLSNCDESMYYADRGDIENSIVEGNVITLFNGRSGNNQWDTDTLLNFETTSDLNFWEYSSIMITSTSNQFAGRDSLSSIAKKLIINNLYGPIAIFSSSALITMSQNIVFFDLIIENLLSEENPSIGNSFLAYKNDNVWLNNRRFYQIFGDPAIIPQMIQSESDIREPLKFEMSFNNNDIFVSIFPDPNWNYIELPLSHYNHLFSDSSDTFLINQLNLFPDGVPQNIISGNILFDNLDIGDSVLFSFDNIENWNVSNGMNDLSIMESIDTPTGSGNSLNIEFDNSNNDSLKSFVYVIFNNAYEISKNDTISFWIKQGESLVGINDPVETLPEKYRLYPPYPNPFNPVTTIRFSIETQYVTSLQIFNITGRLVETLIDNTLTPGEHEIIWNAGNLPSGVYFVRLISGDYLQTQKIILMK